MRKLRILSPMLLAVQLALGSGAVAQETAAQEQVQEQPDGEHQAELAAMRLHEEAEIAALRAEYLEKRNQLIAAEEAALEQLRALPEAHWAEMAQLQASHSDEIAAVTEAHQARIAELTERMAGEREQAEDGLAARRAALQARALEAAEVLALQDDLIAARERVLDNEAWLRAQSADLALRRRDVLADLTGAWSGQITCSGEGAATAAFTLRLDAFVGGNLGGTLALIGHESSAGDLPLVALMVLPGEAHLYPLQLALDSGEVAITDQGDLRLDFALELDEDSVTHLHFPKCAGDFRCA